MQFGWRLSQRQNRSKANVAPVSTVTGMGANIPRTERLVRKRSWELLPLAWAALAACATTGDPQLPSPPASFREVRTLLLVRSAEGRAPGAKDPLDALDESLRARGYTTRVVELRPGRPAQAGLRRLFDDLEARAATPRSERFGTSPYGGAGASARAVVADQGVDAIATFHRIEPLRPLSDGAGPPLSGELLPRAPGIAHGPTGALSVVDRQGHVATFAWGETTALDDPSVPVNAAEAVDLVLRSLAGEELAGERE